MLELCKVLSYSIMILWQNHRWTCNKICIPDTQKLVKQLLGLFFFLAPKNNKQVLMENKHGTPINNHHLSAGRKVPVHKSFGLQCYFIIQMLCFDSKRTQADFRLAPSQWETLLQSNAVSHWLGANLESGTWQKGSKSVRQKHWCIRKIKFITWPKNSYQTKYKEVSCYHDSFFKPLWPSDAIIWYHRTWSTLVQVIACHLEGIRSSPETMLIYCQLDPYKLQWNFKEYIIFYSRRYIENVISKMATILFRPHWVKTAASWHKF